MPPTLRVPGALKLGRWQGAPIYVHWSAPLGALIFSRARLAPGLWVGFVILILAHELGHAFFVRRYGLRTIALVLHALGGECHWTGRTTGLRRSWIAWGGVLAQAVLLVAAALMLAISPPREAFTWDLLHSFLEPNLWLMAANLLPVAPLDGAEAWKVAARLRSLKRRRVASGMIEVAATSRVKGEVARILDDVKDNTRSG